MSDTYGPFNVRPGILDRATNFVDFLVRNRPGTSGYRLWVAKSVEDAYGTVANSGLAGSGGTALLSVPTGGIGQSPLVVRRGWRVEENRRGQTSFQMDPEDVSIGDDTTYYARLQEERAGVWNAVSAGAVLNANYPIRGPIMVVFPAAFHSASASVASLQVKAPKGTTCAAYAPPFIDPTVQVPLPLHLVLPKPANTVTITNLNAAGGEGLLVSYGLGQPMMLVAAGSTSIPTGGGYSQPGVREIILAANVGAASVVPVAIELSIGMEKV